jgi:short-subunit dehydrogenase
MWTRFCQCHIRSRLKIRLHTVASRGLSILSIENWPLKIGHLLFSKRAGRHRRNFRTDFGSLANDQLQIFNDQFSIETYAARTMSQWVLLTGASSGIGLELAKLFAADGYHLALVARNEARLRSLALDLQAKHGIQTQVLPCDLSSASAAEEIQDGLRQTPVSILVNNAGFGACGPFAQSDLRVGTEMMQVNMNSLVQLTRLFVEPMVSIGKGRILNVASTAAFQPGPMVNLYFATKAFVYSFSYALAQELKNTGVTVTVLCPGSTRTEFFSRAGMRMAGGLVAMDAPEVALAGYRGLMKGKRVVIPGIANKVGAFLAKRAPDRLSAAVVARLHKK